MDISCYLIGVTSEVLPSDRPAVLGCISEMVALLAVTFRLAAASPNFVYPACPGSLGFTDNTWLSSSLSIRYLKERYILVPYNDLSLTTTSAITSLLIILLASDALP